MSENLIDYSNFQPDWWDAAGVTGEAIKTEITRLVDNTFGVGGLSTIQKAAMELATFKQYEAQQAMKAAADAAARAASYADVPNSTLFRDALASRIAYENIAKSLVTESGQIMRNAAADGALASKLSEKGAQKKGPGSNYQGELIQTLKLPHPCAWAMGHEGQGVCQELMNRASVHVRIGQPGGEESLNVAAAAAICLHASSL